MDIRNIGKLSRPAAALLGVLLALGYPDDSHSPHKWLADLAGIGQISNYYRARKELERNQLYPLVFGIPVSIYSTGLDNSDKTLSLSILSSASNDGPVERIDESDSALSTLPDSATTTLSADTTLIDSAATTLSAPSTLDSADTTLEDSATTTLYDRCLEVDALPTGEDKVRGDFQVRRRAQIPIVVEAWEHFFTGKGVLTADRARRWLAWASDSSADLYDVFAEFSEKKLESPVTYMEKVLKNKANEGYFTKKAAPPAPATRTDEILPASPEFLAKLKRVQAEAEAYKQQKGWLE